MWRPAWLCRIRHRVGVRGEFLLALALVDAGQCYRLMFPSQETLSSPTNVSLASWMPLPAWGALWGVVGLLCLVQAFMRSDRLAFAAASFSKVGWALANLAVCVWGVPQAWWSVVIWLVFARIVHVFAKVPEQPDQAVPPPIPIGGAP